MDTHSQSPSDANANVEFRHQLRFAWLHDPREGTTFPCDKAGNVDIDSLAEPLRMIYQGACAMLGQYYARPTIQLAE